MPILKLSWKRKHTTKQLEQVVVSKSWFQILHLMDFQRKFNILSWRTLFICCLVLFGRDIFYSLCQATHNVWKILSFIQDIQFWRCFLQEPKFDELLNLYRFYFIIQNTFIRYCFFIYLFSYIICHLSLSMTCTEFHLHLCLNIQRDTLEFYEIKLQEKIWSSPKA